MLSMKSIAIFGAGGFGREVKELIDQINVNEKKYEFIGYFDDAYKIGEKVNGFPILGGVNELNQIDKEIHIVFSIANCTSKEKIFNQLVNRYIVYPVLIHPNCVIGTTNVKIGEGSIICAGTIITCDVTIGNHVIINLSCTIGHDTIIEDYGSFMPCVNISGNVKICRSVYCGTGSKIINQIEIGEYTIIGAGAVVTTNLPAHCTAVGIPAKVIKFHE